jgi:uncharacterized protein YjbI with pentapeptide repeats
MKISNLLLLALLSMHLLPMGCLSPSKEDNFKNSRQLGEKGTPKPKDFEPKPEGKKEKSKEEILNENIEEFREGKGFGIDLKGANLSDMNFKGGILSSDLSDAKANNISLTTPGGINSGNFQKADFRNAKINNNGNGVFFKNNFSQANMQGATIISNTSISNCEFTKAIFLNARITTPGNIDDSDFSGADLKGAYISAAHVVNCKFNGADLRKAKFRGIIDSDDFSAADLRGADFSGSTFSDTKFTSETKLEGAIFDQTTCIGEEFASQNFQKTSFIGAHLERAKLSNTKFNNATLTGASLPSGFDLKNTDFSGADMREIRMPQMMFSNTLLKGANLSGAFFHKPTLVKGTGQENALEKVHDINRLKEIFNFTWDNENPPKME